MAEYFYPAPAPTGGGGGGGNVAGPGTSTNNAVARFSGTDGDAIKNSNVLIDDSGNISTPGLVDGRDVSADGVALDQVIVDQANDELAIASLDSRLGAAEADIDTLQSNVVSLDSRLDTAETDIDTLQSDLNTEEAALAAHIANLSNPHAVTKTQVGLGNVDNTSDATKNAATVTLTNKTMDGASNTFSNLPFTGLTTFTSAQLLAKITDETGSGLVVFNNSPTLITPALGTPSALVLTNATGLPLSTGVNTFSSADLRGRLTDETGSGPAVFGTSPTIGSPTITGYNYVSPGASALSGTSNNAGVYTYMTGGANAYFDAFASGSPASSDLKIRTYNSGPVEAINISATGAINLPQIHNNAGGNVRSGSYTPTVTLGANATGTPVIQPAKWSQTGNVITVSGYINLATTSASNTPTVIFVSLPVASNLQLGGDLAGTGTRAAGSGVAYQPVIIFQDTTNDRAEFNFNSTVAASQNLSYVFQYEVK